MAASHQHSDYVLVGAGCFGASTALYLKRTFPQKSVTLIDRTPFHNPSAAAHDLNKIIRAECEDKVYMKLALEGQWLWRSDPILKPYYHETGIIFAGIPGPGTTIVENYKAVTCSSPCYAH
jgi:sarcosine oxidase/L-pipecolate oxidase